jgi:hypothetical protein
VLIITIPIYFISISPFFKDLYPFLLFAVSAAINVRVRMGAKLFAKNVDETGEPLPTVVSSNLTI